MFIELSRGLQTEIDDADYALVSSYSWHAKPKDSSLGGWYAFTSINGKTVYMHRHITGAAKGQYIDHINGDSLNNKRENLRFCTISQNNANIKRPKNASGYKGVYKVGEKRWRVIMGTHPRKTEGGSFKCPIEAAKRYDELAIAMYGEFAHTNFPQ